MTQQRWFSKANAMSGAWRTKFGADPPFHALVLALAHGELETQLGDAWVGEHNVGAVQDRKLAPAESYLLHAAGVDPGFHNVDAAKGVLGAARLRTAGLHCDSSPVTGPYFVYFRVFDSDEDGDLFFLHEIVDERPHCKAVLMAPGGSEAQYAAALYGSRYFEGMHDPGSVYELRAGHWVKLAQGEASSGGPTESGTERNIGDYTDALLRFTPGIRSALATWSPGASLPLSEPVKEADLAVAAATYTSLIADLRDEDEKARTDG